MSGLLLLGVLGTWTLVAGFCAVWLTRRWQGRPLRVVLALTAFALLLPLVFIDEIVGKYQLRALCREGGAPHFDEAKTKGRTVYMRQVSHPQAPGVSGTPSRIVPAWIPINERSIEWLDLTTNEPVLSYKAYTASGGWLIRLLQISESDSPLTFDPNSCAFNEIPLFKRLQVNFK